MMVFSRLTRRAAYWRRITSAYLLPGKSQLTFWHGTPLVNDQARFDQLGQYYMPFLRKADYAGDYDRHGVPQLNYHGEIGLQYNPIAIAQYALGNYNHDQRRADPERRRNLLAAADWLVENLEANPQGAAVWMHHFDWEYRTTLKAPWYSGLAQGQGISALLRAHQISGERRYLEAATAAFGAFQLQVGEGGVVLDEGEGSWIEEYIVDPPTHILNGFIWALWGVYDYSLVTEDPDARRLFARAVRLLRVKLPSFDTGYWSLYEHSGTAMKMLASSFYHQLHIVQLRVLQAMTGEPIFGEVAERWERYRRRRLNRWAALAYKAVFKFFYY